MNRFLTPGKVLVVAEIGNNHEGDFEVARELVRIAADCGVDAVKFQTFKTRHLVSERDSARFERLSSFELSFGQFEELQALAKSLDLLFVSTPFDLASAAFLADLVDFYKIASSDNTFWPLLDTVSQTGKPMVLSTGLAGLEEIEKSKSFIEEHWQAIRCSSALAVLHCVSCYPVPEDQASLASIPFLKDRLGGIVGYSDHTLGLTACLTAVALGARIIEKHFTLDKQHSDFRDHQLSADPEEMKLLVDGVARVTRMLGVPGKTIQPCEAESKTLIRRSIVAAGDFPQGHRLALDDLTWIRPGGGCPPGTEDQLLDRTLNRSISFGEPIILSDLE